MSNLLRSQELDGLKEIFLFANTPSYLYKNFRQNPAVFGLAKKYQTEELIEFFEQFVKSEKLDAESLITSYALLFAISLKDYAESRRFLKGIDRYKNLEWIKELQQIILANAKATNIRSVDLDYKRNGISLSKPARATSKNVTTNYTVELAITQGSR